MKNNKSDNSKERPRKDVLRGNRHLVFIEDVPKFKIENPLVKEVTLYLSTFEEDKIDLAAITHSLKDIEPNDIIRLSLNSAGGYVYEGKSLINSIQRTGAFIETELVADAASMAAVIFCIGEKRIIYENSSIMFHTFTSGVYGKGQEVEDHIEHKNKNINAFFRSHIIGLTEKEIERMIIGKEFWFGAEEMCQREIATHVRIGEVIIPAKKYLKLLKKVRKVGKKNKIKIGTLGEALIYNIDPITPLLEENRREIEVIYKKLNELVAEHPDLYT